MPSLEVQQPCSVIHPGRKLQILLPDLCGFLQTAVDPRADSCGQGCAESSCLITVHPDDGRLKDIRERDELI